MFSTLRGFSPLYKNVSIKQRAFFICHGFSSRSVKNLSKLPTQGLKFKFRYDRPAKIIIQYREFHTTLKRDVPPLLALILRPVLRIGYFIFGRKIRKWWRQKDASERERYIAWFRNRKPYLYGIIGVALSTLLIYYLAHIENTPITNRSRFIMFTTKQQAAFAKFMFETHLELHKDHIVPKTDPVYRRLLAVTNRVLNANKDVESIKQKQWTLSVIDLPARNAYVLPGGNIFIFTGILQMVENDDQLSFIIAHEMAHALLKHSMEQVSNGFIIDVLLAVPIVMISALFPDLTAAFIQFVGQQFLTVLHDLPFSRSLETEADEVGLTLAAKACVDVREAVVFWGLMRAMKDFGAEPKEIPWLSTHPNHEDREKKLDEKMSKAIALRNSHQCPGLDPIDPRKKFYERSPKEIEAQFKQRVSGVDQNILIWGRSGLMAVTTQFMTHLATSAYGLYQLPLN